MQNISGFVQNLDLFLVIVELESFRCNTALVLFVLNICSNVLRSVLMF